MSDYYLSKMAPQRRHATAVPSDVTSYTNINGLFVTVAGNLVIEDEDGVTITYPVVAGDILPFRATKIKAATTATVILWRG
jgi:hypothetical protein